jgi:UDP-N-acetyl-D-galactosamine dehydrogenase
VAVLKRGDVVVYESTVYRRDRRNLRPELERASGLRFNHDFTVGYSPERINPGDRERRLTNIPKVTSGSTPEAADSSTRCTHRSSPPARTRPSSIQVAEASKVIENTQRDVNIALMKRVRADLPSPRHRHAPKCCERAAPSGTSCRSAPAWSAGIASAWTRIT